MADAIVAEVELGKTVCAVFYGHPGVFARPSHLAIERTRALGHRAEMLPAVSAEDCLFADLGVDPGDGCQSFEATNFVVRPPGGSFDPPRSVADRGARRLDTSRPSTAITEPGSARREVGGELLGRSRGGRLPGFDTARTSTACGAPATSADAGDRASGAVVRCTCRQSRSLRADPAFAERVVRMHGSHLALRRTRRRSADRVGSWQSSGVSSIAAVVRVLAGVGGRCDLELRSTADRPDPTVLAALAAGDGGRRTGPALAAAARHRADARARFRCLAALGRPDRRRAAGVVRGAARGSSSGR